MGLTIVSRMGTRFDKTIVSHMSYVAFGPVHTRQKQLILYFPHLLSLSRLVQLVTFGLACYDNINRVWITRDKPSLSLI